MNVTTDSRKNLLDQFSNLAELRARHSFLAEVPYSVDEWAATELQDYIPSLPPLDRLALRQQLQRASVLLERVFARRNEIQEISVRAFARAVEYERFAVLTKFEREMAVATSMLERYRVAAEGERNASDAFFGVKGTDGAAQTAAGLGHQALAASEVSDRSINAEQARESLVSTRITALERIEATIKEAHNLPYGPLNYGRRIDRLKRLYLLDLKQAVDFERLVADGTAAFGLPLEAPIPDVRSPELGWMLADRIRTISRHFDLDQGRRVEISLPITLTHIVNNTGTYPDAAVEGRDATVSLNNLKYWVENVSQRMLPSGPGLSFKVFAEEADAAQDPAEFKIVLSDLVPEYRDFRLLAVGAKTMISLGIPENRHEGTPSEIADKRQRQAAAIARKLPIRVDLQVHTPSFANEVETRPPLRLSEVTATNDVSLASGVSGSDVESRGIVGAWNIKLSGSSAICGTGPLKFRTTTFSQSGVLKGDFGLLRLNHASLGDLRPSIDSGAAFLEGFVLYLALSAVPR